MCVGPNSLPPSVICLPKHVGKSQEAEDEAFVPITVTLQGDKYKLSQSHEGAPFFTYIHFLEEPSALGRQGTPSGRKILTPSNILVRGTGTVRQQENIQKPSQNGHVMSKRLHCNVNVKSRKNNVRRLALAPQLPACYFRRIKTHVHPSCH